MLFRVLGPLAVEPETGPLVLAGSRTRALLTALLLDPGKLVPVWRGPAYGEFADGFACAAASGRPNRGGGKCGRHHCRTPPARTPGRPPPCGRSPPLGGRPRPLRPTNSTATTCATNSAWTRHEHCAICTHASCGPSWTRSTRPFPTRPRRRSPGPRPPRRGCRHDPPRSSGAARHWRAWAPRSPLGRW